MNQDAVAVVVINDVQFVSNWRRGRCQQRPRDRRRETKACLPIHYVVKSQIDGRGERETLRRPPPWRHPFALLLAFQLLTLFVVVVVDALVKYFEIGCCGNNNVVVGHISRFISFCSVSLDYSIPTDVSQLWFYRGGGERRESRFGAAPSIPSQPVAPARSLAHPRCLLFTLGGGCVAGGGVLFPPPRRLFSIWREGGTAQIKCEVQLWLV